MSPFAARRDRLRRFLAEQQLDALIVNAPVNVRYLTGFTGDATYLLLATQGEWLVSDSRFTQQIAEECPGVPAEIRVQGDITPQTLAKTVKTAGLRRLGIEAGRLSVAEFEKLKELIPTAQWKSTSAAVETIRAVKEPGEVEIIRRAVGVAERVYEQFRRDLQPDDTEIDLSDRVEYLVRKLGGRYTSFDTIAAVGARSALAHAPPTKARVRDAGFLLLDWGAVVDGYRSDLTRILVTHKSQAQSVNAVPFDDRRLKAVYEAVLTARDRAVAAVRPGVAAKDVDAAARAVFEERGLLEHFTHSTGHGLGLETHERPGLRATSDETLAEGMVVTIEPGLYFEGWGGVRIEDDLLVTSDGAEVLNALPRDLASAYL